MIDMTIVFITSWILDYDFLVQLDSFNAQLFSKSPNLWNQIWLYPEKILNLLRQLSMKKKSWDSLANNFKIVSVDSLARNET